MNYLQQLFYKIQAKYSGKEDYSSVTPMSIGTLLAAIVLWGVVVVTLGAYCWDNAAVPLIPSLRKTGSAGGKMKILGLSVLSSIILS